MSDVIVPPGHVLHRAELTAGMVTYTPPIPVSQFSKGLFWHVATRAWLPWSCLTKAMTIPADCTHIALPLP